MELVENDPGVTSTDTWEPPPSVLGFLEQHFNWSLAEEEKEAILKSGTYGLKEELGRHRGKEGKSECTLCGAECESVVHVLWECSAYSSSRVSFMVKLEQLSGDRYADFEVLNSVEEDILCIRE